MVLKRCTISLLSRHLGLEESKITGHSNKREKIARLSKRVPKGFKLKTRITNAWSQEEIDLCSLWAEVDDKHRRKIEKRRKDYRILKPNFHLLPFLWKEKEITGLLNSTCIRLCSRHGLEKVKPQGRKWYQMLFHFLKRSKKAKLQGSQEYRPHPKPMVIWKEIELQWHDTQTSYWQRAVWKRIKLQGSQTPPWCSSRFRREIHGSQTYTQAKDIDRLTWKKIELQGSQTIHFNLRLV